MNQRIKGVLYTVGCARTLSPFRHCALQQEGTITDVLNLAVPEAVAAAAAS